MESAEPGPGTAIVPGKGPEAGPAAPPRGPGFWNEIYWLAVISLAGLVVLLLMLPPRWNETAMLLERERSLRREGAELLRREEVLTRAIESVENDPFYREAVYRRRLGVKRPSEVFLEEVPAGFPVGSPAAARDGAPAAPGPFREPPGD